MSVGMTVVLLDERDERRKTMENILTKSGYEVAPPIASCLQLADACARYKPDAVIISATKPDSDVLDALPSIKDGRPCPVVVFSEDDSRKSIERSIAAGVNAYVVTGLGSNRIRSAVDLAVANFAQTEALRSEAAAARQALDDRKIIERAKGILMKHRNLDEEAAYRLLRERSMERSEPLADVARMVQEAAEMLIDDDR